MKATKKLAGLVLGLDIGDRSSTYCLMTRARCVLSRGSIATERKKLKPFFESLKPCRVVLEAGAQSNWIATLAREVGHETAVANPRKLKALTASNKKTDRVDAFLLARFGVSDVDLLHVIEHRSLDAQVALSDMHSRDQLICARTTLVNYVRATVKVVGERLPKCNPDSFDTRTLWEIPKALRRGLIPVLRVIENLTRQIQKLDRHIARLSKTKYPQTELLRAVKGVGPLNALAMVLTIGDPRRFKTSRQVGCYFGLVPKKRQSGDFDPELGITKEGSSFARRLAVSAAQYVLGPFAEDSDVRRYGQRIIDKNGGSKVGKKKAVVAVARKLAVLCHRLLLTGEVYDPFHSARPKGEPAPAVA
jgi:transposase